MNKLTKSQCRELAEYISDKDLTELIENAKINVPDWTKPARCNKLFSRGSFWNRFIKLPFTPGNHRTIWKMRILEEFGEFRPIHILPKIKEINSQIITIHEDPIF